MKKTWLLGTLVAALAAGSAQAGVLPLQDATITASYNGAGAGMLGLDHGFADEAGSNVTAIDPTETGGVEFLTADYLFGFDFSNTGLLTVYNNGAIPTGAYSMRFDFGASLAAPIASMALLDHSAIGGTPLLSIVDAHTLGLDLSNVSWNADFASFTAQIGLDSPASLPEPGGAALLLTGLAGLALSRRRSR